MKSRRIFRMKVADESHHHREKVRERDEERPAGHDDCAFDMFELACNITSAIVAVVVVAAAAVLVYIERDGSIVEQQQQEERAAK